VLHDIYSYEFALAALGLNRSIIGWPRK